MKCEKCGKNEANYYYSSNINGNVTEKHLCSECAAEFEHGNEFAHARNMFSEMNSTFDNMFGSMLGKRGLLDTWDNFGFGMPSMLMPRINIMLGGYPEVISTHEKMQESEKEKAVETKIDPEVNKMREINALRYKMREAANNEDYEKAAELRDKIKELENKSAE